jgi:hypothetical protein
MTRLVMVMMYGVGSDDGGGVDDVVMMMVAIMQS